MNLIVHIGTPKTGTTTIQEMLFESREILKSKGFHFLQCAGKKIIVRSLRIALMMEGSMSFLETVE